MLQQNLLCNIKLIFYYKRTMDRPRPAFSKNSFSEVSVLEFSADCRKTKYISFPLFVQSFSFPIYIYIYYFLREL